MDPGPAAGPPYVPVERRPWRLTMGLRPLPPAQWLEVDGQRRHELDLKWSVLDRPDGHDQAVAGIAGTGTAGTELLHLVVDHLAAHHAGLVEWVAPGVMVERSTGRHVDAAALHPVDAAGRLVQEDLCLMVRRNDRWVLGAASVCFPSRWSLAEKIGRDLGAIHGPVPGYAGALGEPVERFFDRIRPERPVWRLNWTLLDTPVLRLPDGQAAPPAPSPGDIGGRTWFRVERQTLRRLPVSGAVVFTIRTYVTALHDLVAARPGVAADLATSLRSTPPATLDYKGWRDVQEPLVAWLEARSGTGEEGQQPATG